MIELPQVALRRLPPDSVQLQVIIGSLLGDGQVEGRAGLRHLRVNHSRERESYVRWKYERLGAFASSPPRAVETRLELISVPHPVFDDLARLDRAALIELLGPLGLAVWLADLGRLELSAESFLPHQRTALCA